MATPVFDAASSGEQASGTTLTVAHTVTTNSNRGLWVATVNRNAGVGTITGVTYAGSAMTQLGTTIAVANGDVKLWFLLAPATGTNNIVATCSADRAMTLGGMSFYDLDQATPNGTVSQGAGLSRTVTITDTQLLLSFAGLEGGGTAPLFTSTGTAQTERFDTGVAAGIYFVTGASQTGNGSITASFTFGGSNDGDGTYAVPINVVAAAGNAGSSAGTSTNTATGASSASGAGSGTATSTNTATGASVASGAGSSTSTALATAVGASNASGVGNGVGTSLATAVGTTVASGSGSGLSEGTSTATAVSATVASGAGSSAGTSTATAVGADAANTTVDRSTSPWGRRAALRKRLNQVKSIFVRKEKPAPNTDLMVIAQAIAQKLQEEWDDAA